MTRPSLTVMLADDSVPFRQGLAGMLADHGFAIAASVGTGHALLQEVLAAPPDAVVVDVRMRPDHRTEGIDTAIEIRERCPDVGVGAVQVRRIASCHGPARRRVRGCLLPAQGPRRRLSRTGRGAADLAPTDNDHRRVLAVLAHLRA